MYKLQQNRDFPIATWFKVRTFAMSSRHGGKRVVSLPRDTEGKSADVEVFTLLTAVKASGALSTHFF